MEDVRKIYTRLLQSTESSERLRALDELEYLACEQELSSEFKIELGRLVVDKYLGRWVSRKLAVWVVGTIAFIVGKLSGDLWVGLSLGYIGAQGAADLASMWKHGKRM